MTPYTPPEPAYFMTKNGRLWTYPDEVDQTGLELRIFTEAQLRSEAERVRRETVEECAMKMESQYTWLTNAAAANIIRSLK